MSLPVGPHPNCGVLLTALAVFAVAIGTVAVLAVAVFAIFAITVFATATALALVFVTLVVVVVVVVVVFTTHGVPPVSIGCGIATISLESRKSAICSWVELQK